MTDLEICVTVAAVDEGCCGATDTVQSAWPVAKLSKTVSVDLVDKSAILTRLIRTCNFEVLASNVTCEVL